jgi:hypothetical protein
MEQQDSNMLATNIHLSQSNYVVRFRGCQLIAHLGQKQDLLATDATQELWDAWAKNQKRESSSWSWQAWSKLA